MAQGGAYSDLAPRLITAIGLAAVGAAAVWAGGIPFLVFAAAAVAALVWELATMLGSDRSGALRLGAAAGAVLVAADLLPELAGLLVIAAACFVGAFLGPTYRGLRGVFGAMILLGAFILVSMRADYGVLWLVWIVLLVIATDIAGYFAGRAFGGPKLWPRVSPKKTWSGTVAGWIASAVVGAVLAGIAGVAVLPLVLTSVLVSMAAQAGDIAESAVKRRVGVKDSSNLLPGHGGVFDRFDGMLGAGLAMFFVKTVSEFPPLPL